MGSDRMAYDGIGWHTMAYDTGPGWRMQQSEIRFGFDDRGSTTPFEERHGWQGETWCSALTGVDAAVAVAIWRREGKGREGERRASSVAADFHSQPRLEPLSHLGNHHPPSTIHHLTSLTPTPTPTPANMSNKDVSRPPLFARTPHPADIPPPLPHPSTTAAVRIPLQSRCRRAGVILGASIEH